MRLKRVISGGQTGVDVASLVAAKVVGLETGGTMPRGFKTLLGSKPEYARLFGVVEDASPAYPPRTEKNVLEGDATLQIAIDFNSAGEILTTKLAKKHRKPNFQINPKTVAIAHEAAEWIKEGDFEVINVAGNSHKTDPAIGLFAFEFLVEVFAELGFEIQNQNVYRNANDGLRMDRTSIKDAR